MHICLGTTPTVQLTMMFPRLELDEVNRAAAVHRHASGKSLNVARVLHTLGEDVRACLPLGGDTGLFMRHDLDASGIKYLATEIASPTRTCVTIVDQAGQTTTELVEEHATLSADECTRLQASAVSLLGGAKLLILSGSLARGVSADFYAQCCQHAAMAGVPVILDARDQPLTLALQHKPLIVKPNRAELATTVGLKIDGESSLKKAIVALHERGPQWVIVTMGKEGAVASDGERFWKIPGLKIESISPIGSGDAFAAGLAAGISRGQEIPQACRLATACAAANCLMPGSGLLRLEDVERLEKLTTVEGF
jgi:tagatose 6-phosphate kinase